jgi:hypothetical protein
MLTLIYGNRKIDDVKWDITAPEARSKAFLELFRMLKGQWSVYASAYWGETKEEQKLQKELYRKASKGDAAAAEQLLTMRIEYEYENWRIVETPDSGPGEPRRITAQQPQIDIKALRRSDHGRVALVLQSDEEIEMAILPLNTTGPNWKHAGRLTFFIENAMREAVERTSSYQKVVSELLSHINTLRVILYKTMHPETMRLGPSMPHVQENAIEHASALLLQYGDTEIEDLPNKKRRPTELQDANDRLSDAVRNLEGLLEVCEMLINEKYDRRSLKLDVARIKKTLQTIKNVDTKYNVPA